MSSLDIEKKFLIDVGQHEMEVVFDQGFMRCLKFRNPNCNSAWFDIVTFEGGLLITGDYGSFCFRRLPDMFEFFGDARNGLKRINPSYWLEKCVAEDRSDGCLSFSYDAVLKSVKSYLEYSDLSDYSDAIIAELLEQGLDSATSVEEVRDTLTHFDWKGEYIFDDMSMGDRVFQDYSFYYLWCCHAIVWAIDQYDKYRADHIIEKVEFCHLDPESGKVSKIHDQPQ